MRKSKSKTIPIIIILILIISCFVLFKRVLNKPLNTSEDIVINVQEGDSFYSIINTLSKENKIKNLSLIKLFVKISRKNIDVKPGEYVLQKDLNVNELINTLTSESSLNIVKFTVPEGYTIDDISEKLEKEGICSKEDFIKAIKEYELPSFVNINSEKRYNLEGYLFPDTYLIKVGETPKEIITKMVARFKEMLNEAIKEVNTTVKDEDIETVVTIASMIEKEARIDSERPVIASVIVNRLNIDMMLQIDATVIYALGEHVDTVLYSHLETNSPYNTYKNYGLPVGPISNPGLESIKAALKPEQTDYLFYVLQNDKTHYFTNNYEDFIKKQNDLGY
ncbi:MAG: endolytic transglycosylase MltG [Clostridium sp.]|uniref:endolytic transglycosylase MltG n=1 Tax=Clostridium sp. TaxID=1506 RepID=UPI001ED2B58F|nr:endolytic transglycosylase MltG [Clostridium sp.]MBS5883373.1 endolytic transglycosylase MltG [Clostridium sp.]MDU7146997.1 endolytic transglycosylase MltG [Clostridium sp.]MDU7240093.1 endolytic transglycosylase MltG [Clostridium sp.]